MLRPLAAAAILLLALPALGASDIGTCLTSAGVRVAPWTDPVDPACGEDCNNDDDNDAPSADDNTLCSTTDGTCGIEDAAERAPRMPAPAGPRCLEPGPWCTSGDPIAVGGAGFNLLIAPRPATAPQRARGLLPRSEPEEFIARPVDRHVPPRTPPPR
ncbi:MAG: hypothetical protein KC620_17240 [Myxococcales bacterium]|nr:hypothetical protein [Myxococcales bacterium]